jgi:hypothetical protein
MSLRPEYNPKRDGNPFDWILKAAQAERSRSVERREAALNRLRDDFFFSKPAPRK